MGIVFNTWGSCEGMYRQDASWWVFQHRPDGMFVWMWDPLSDAGRSIKIMRIV